MEKVLALLSNSQLKQTFKSWFAHIKVNGNFPLTVAEGRWCQVYFWLLLINWFWFTFWLTLCSVLLLHCTCEITLLDSGSVRWLLSPPSHSVRSTHIKVQFSAVSVCARSSTKLHLSFYCGRVTEPVWPFIYWQISCAIWTQGADWSQRKEKPAQNSPKPCLMYWCIIFLVVAFFWQKSKVSSWRRDEIMTSEILIWYAGDAADFPTVSLGVQCLKSAIHFVQQIQCTAFHGVYYCILVVHVSKLKCCAALPFYSEFLPQQSVRQGEDDAFQLGSCALSALFPFPFSSCTAWAVTGCMLPALFLSPNQLWSLHEHCSYVSISSFPLLPMQRENWIVNAS